MKFEINGKTKKNVSHYIGCRQLTKAHDKVQELSEHVHGYLPLNRLQTATKALDEVRELLLSKHVHVKCTYSKLVQK